jgi:hypothetical protein
MITDLGGDEMIPIVLTDVYDVCVSPLGEQIAISAVDGLNTVDMDDGNLQKNLDLHGKLVIAWQ